MVFFEKKSEIGHHTKNPFETDCVHVDPETQELYGKITICNVTKIVFFFFWTGSSEHTETHKGCQHNFLLCKSLAPSNFHLMFFHFTV